MTFTIAGHLIIPYYMQVMLFRKCVDYNLLPDYILLLYIVPYNLNDSYDSVKYNLGDAKYQSTYFDAKHSTIQGHFLRSIEFIKFSSETTLVINEKSI